MAISGWLVLAGACLTYVALGLWAISKIFPWNRTPTPGSDPEQQQESGRPPTTRLADASSWSPEATRPGTSQTLIE